MSRTASLASPFLSSEGVAVGVTVGTQVCASCA